MRALALLLTLALLLACPAVWAATWNQEGQTCTTTGTGPYTSSAFTPQDGDLLLVFAVVSNTAVVATMTNSEGTQMVLHVAGATNAAFRTSLDRLYVFIANSYSTAVSQTVTIDVTGDPGTGACIGIIAVAGMHRVGVGAVRQVGRQQNQAAGGTPAPAFPAAALSTNPIFGAIGNNSNPAAMTPPTDWIEPVADGGYNTPTTGFQFVGRASGFTGETVTWGSTSASTFASYIIELDASGCETSNFGPLMGVACQ